MLIFQSLSHKYQPSHLMRIKIGFPDTDSESDVLITASIPINQRRIQQSGEYLCI